MFPSERSYQRPGWGLGLPPRPSQARRQPGLQEAIPATVPQPSREEPLTREMRLERVRARVTPTVSSLCATGRSSLL